MSDGNGSIPKGFILKARKIEDSEVAHASPCTREMWDLILRKANFRNRKCGNTTIKRANGSPRMKRFRSFYIGVSAIGNSPIRATRSTLLRNTCEAD